MAELRIAFRLPTAGRPRAVLVSDYGLTRAQLFAGDEAVLTSSSRAALRAGVSVPFRGGLLTLRATHAADALVLFDGVEAPREDRLRVRPTRSAWIHAWLALAGSVAGLIASWLYVRRAGASGDAWAMKMAVHMAGWHLLLALTLFPASAWGQRAGIRAVQGAALVFFAIHLGIAISNAISPSPHEGPAIALMNALSGAAFLVTVLQGQRAHGDMSERIARA